MSAGEFEFLCPICQGACRASESLRGKQIQCPECLSPILVPETSPSEGKRLTLDQFMPAGTADRATEVSAQQREGAELQQGGLAKAAVSRLPSLAAEQREPTSTEQGHVVFCEQVWVDGNLVPLVISDRRIQAGSILDVSVERICGVRLIVTAARDLVCGELLYAGEDGRLHRIVMQVKKLIRSRVRCFGLRLAEAMRKVLTESGKLQLLEQAGGANEGFWHA